MTLTKSVVLRIWEFPHSVSELRKFIGLTSYYRSFCPNYSQVAEPLTECLRKGASVQCTPRRLQAFNKLQEFLTTAPVIAMPTDDGDYVLDVDGRQIEASAVLQQYQNGKLRVIENASRTYYITYCYDASPHSSTGFAPHILMTGQEPRWNIYFVLNDVNLSVQTVPGLTSSMLDRLNKAFVIVCEHLQQSTEIARTWYNKNIKVHLFCFGDRVRIYNPRSYQGKSPKWQSFYKDEAVVKQRRNAVT